MKKLLLVTIILFSLVGCLPEKNNVPPKNDKFSIESAEKVLGIGKLLINKQQISDQQWQDLFKSTGYRQYLIYSDSSTKQQWIKEALITVFHPDNRKVLDSLLGIPIQMDRNFLKLSLIKNINALKINLAQEEDFLNTTDFTAVIATADSLAQTFLPNSIKDSLPKLHNVYMIISDPDAKVMQDAIVVDLNTSFQMGKDGLAKLIAHEYHHNYRALTTKPYEHPLLVQLNKVHQEGLADLIDKDEPPIEEMGLFPKAILEIYNKDYQNTPNNLRTLDSLTQEFLAQELDTTAYYQQINNYFKFGGHTAGIYMSFKISKTLGKEVLIENYNDPIKFIELYNDVAKASPGDHVFSSTFLSYIKKLDQ